MADEYVVSVGVKADFSDLKAKQAEATAAVKEAQTAWEAAYKAFGAAATQGSAQAIAALAEYRAALDAALARQAALSTSNEAFTATSNAATAAAREMSQQTAAASVNMRVLEGSTMGAARAAGQFAVQSLGLGSVLGSGFAGAAFGAAALGMIVVSLGEKLYKAFDIGGEGARKLHEQMRANLESMKEQNDALDVQIAREEIATAKMEKKPVSGIQLAAAEAISEVDRLQQRLDAALKTADSVVNSMGAATTKQIFTMGLGGSGTDYERVMVSEHARRLSEARTEQDKLNESTSFFASLQTRLKQLQGWQSGKLGGAPGIETNFDNEIQATQHLMAVQKLEQEHIEKTIQLQKAQKQHGAEAKQATSRTSYTDIAAQKREEGASLSDMVMYWQQVVATTGRYHSELLHAEAEYHKQMTEHSKLRAEAEKLQAHGAAPNPIDPLSLSRVSDRRQIQNAESAQEEATAEAEAAAKVAEARVQYLASGRAISQQTAAQERATIHVKEYADRIRALREELLALQKIQQQGGDTQVQQQAVQTKMTALQGDAGAASYTDMIGASRQNASEWKQTWGDAFGGATDMFSQSMATWITTNDGYNTQFSVLMGRTMLQVTTMFTQQLVLMAAKWLEHELLMTAIHLAGIKVREGADQQSDSRLFSMLMAKLGWHTSTEEANTAVHVQANAVKTTDTLASQAVGTTATVTANAVQLASTTGAAAATVAVNKATATQSIGAKAADAAAGAWNALSNIPIVGPALGAAAAAATWVGVMALAAFEKGGIIPGSVGSAVPILGHAGEAVLPQPLTQMLMSTAQNGGGGGQQVHFHNNASFSGIDGASVAGMARQHSATFTRQAMRQLRVMNKI